MKVDKNQPKRSPLRCVFNGEQAVKFRVRMKSCTFLLGCLFWGLANVALASEPHYTFLGNRWTDQRHHSVSTIAEWSDDGVLRAHLIVGNSRIPELPWRVEFVVGVGKQLVFDGSLYKVTEIAPDYAARERMRNAIEKKTIPVPCSGDVRDVVIVSKVSDSVFEEGQMVLPVTPAVLYFAVTTDKELELIFDGVRVTEEQKNVAKIRWRMIKDRGYSNRKRSLDTYKIVEGEPGVPVNLTGVGKLQIDDIILASEQHPAWLVLQIFREPHRD